MKNPPDFIRQFDGKFEDGLSVSLRASVQPPPPLTTNRRRDVCGGGGDWLVSDG